jgi:2-iminobutanoate/2-iminopropanoate deaminase
MTPPSPAEQPVARRTPVTLPDAPLPKGAYSPGMRAGDLLFVSGQVPRDPSTGQLVPGDVADQTRQTLRNLSAVLEAGGASLADLVSVTVYLQDIGDWDTFDRVYREFMQPPFPTRTALGASLHGFLVEISGIAYVGAR